MPQCLKIKREHHRVFLILIVLVFLSVNKAVHGNVSEMFKSLEILYFVPQVQFSFCL